MHVKGPGRKSSQQEAIRKFAMQIMQNYTETMRTEDRDRKGNKK
jgi:hypothetical protein